MPLNFTIFLSLLFPFSFPFFLSTPPSFSSLLFYHISLPFVHPLRIYHLSIIHLFIHLSTYHLSIHPSSIYLLYYLFIYHLSLFLPTYPSIITYLPIFYSVILWTVLRASLMRGKCSTTEPHPQSLFYPSYRQGCIKLCRLTLNLLHGPSRLSNL